MNSSPKMSERGSSLLLIAFGVVVLLGFAALAIDGGMLYVQKRFAQNAADAASLTGALALTQGYSGAQLEYIVRERAKENGFDNDDPDTTIVVNWPPQAPNPYVGNPNYIQVFVTGAMNSAFAHFVYSGPLQVSVEAIAHARLGEDFAPGYAIFAANLSECQTLEFDGNPELVLSGGGSIFSNSECDCPSGGAGVMNGNGNVHVVDGQIKLGGCWVKDGESGTVSPIPVTGYPQQALPTVPIPDCTGLDDFGDVVVKDTESITPGLYESIKFSANADATMEPGLYCIYGTGAGGLALPALGSARVTGDGVMLYFMENAGGMTTSANSEIYLTAPEGWEHPSVNDWAGMLIYAHPNNREDIILTGTSNSSYIGTIYAPGSYCEAQGTSGSVALETQLVCDTVGFGGTGDLDISYDVEKLYHLPDAVELTN
jgi:hypothetical protein